MTLSRILPALMALAVSLPSHTLAAECIVPSKPGGAMDLTCKLVKRRCRRRGRARA